MVKDDRGIDGQKWKRHVLDTYGTPNQQLKTGDGPGHYIVCADFDGDGDDEFLLSLFGPLDRDDKGESIAPGGGPHPFKGIMYYKAIDLKNGIFAKWKIAEESSARIALGDFAGKGLIDIVSMKYNVKRYYEEPAPVVTLHLNQFAAPQVKSSSHGIYPTLWDNEGMIYLSDPAADPAVVDVATLSVIEVANYLISVEIYPKKSAVQIPSGEGIKVIYGSIGFYDEKNPYRLGWGTKATPNEVRSPFSVAPFTASATTSSKKIAFADEKTGAILLRFTPTNKPGTWSKASDVPVSTKLDLSAAGVALPPLSFQKVDTTWWGRNNDFFKGVDFYNMTGFHFRLLGSKKVIAHTQFWTAGTKVNCGVHNHTDNIFSEVHVCLSMGTENGGMERLKPSYEHTPPKDLNSLGSEAFDYLTLKPLQEHGGMWERDPYGNAVRAKNNVVKYPWHKWQAGSGKNIDVWMAIEFNPDL